MKTKVKLHLTNGTIIEVYLDGEYDEENVDDIPGLVAGPRWMKLGSAMVFSHHLSAIELA